jgi:8-oxo-dGTP pyrophosphatase MutT (NUDIX family)
MAEPPPDAPVTPRPAAGIVLLRRGGKHSQRALEVLLVKRTEAARFMPGVWVFPGGAVDAGDGEGDAGYRACAIRELAEEASIELPAGEELVLFSRWITPAVIPIRFDAWFFLALAPAHTPPEPDGIEVTEAAWWKPGEAVDAHGRGELPLSFPTLNQLRWLTAFPTSEAALTDFRGREVNSVTPQIIGEGPARRPVLPGQPSYETDVGACA